VSATDPGKLDVEHQVNAEERAVSTRLFGPGEAAVVTITRIYDAEVEDVWDACTNPERIPRWFLPVTGELRLGGRYQLEGNAGGVVEACDPPRGFDATWEMGGDVSWIQLRLAPAGPGRTRFQLEHIAHVDDERWGEFGPGAVGVGWDLGLLGLYLHLASGGEQVDPASFMTWSASPDGIRFVTLSSDAWCAASAASGTDESTARAAADRTTAAYTGS
jgi:uncharacterized protein YndB with AHSA1/START domain